MTSSQIESALSELFEQWAGERPGLVLPLAPSGSHRIYYRLSGNGKSAIGAYNQEELDALIKVDGTEEFAIYAAVAGKIKS